LDEVLTEAMRAAYAEKRVLIGPKGYTDRIYRRKRLAKPAVREVLDTAERLLTAREEHGLHGMRRSTLARGRTRHEVRARAHCTGAHTVVWCPTFRDRPPPTRGRGPSHAREARLCGECGRRWRISSALIQHPRFRLMSRSERSLRSPLPTESCRSDT